MVENNQNSAILTYYIVTMIQSAIEEYERLEEEAEAALVDRTTDYEYRPPTPGTWQVWAA